MFDFPETVKALDEVPNEYRGLYEEKDGAIALISGLRKFHDDRKALNDTLAKERTRSKNAERDLQAWKALAENPDALKAKLDEEKSALTKERDDLKKLIDDKGDATKQFEKWKAETEANARKAIDAAEGKVKGMSSTLERHLIESAAKSAIAEKRGNVKLLLPHVKGQCRVIEENGDFIVRVVDGEGDALSDGKGGFLDIAGLVEQMRKSDDYSSAFEAEERGGSGAPPANGGRSGAKHYSLADWHAKTSAAKPEERKQLLKDKAEGRITVS